MWCGHLLPGVGGEVEHEHCEEGDAHAGDDEVHGVEQGLPPHGDVEGDVQVGLVTARVELHIPGEERMRNVSVLRHLGYCIYTQIRNLLLSALLPAAKLPHIYHLIFSICSLGQNNKGHLPFF